MSSCDLAATADASARASVRRVFFHPDQAKFTLPQAQAFTGQSRSTLYRLFNQGLLTPQRILGRTVIDGNQLREMLANLPAAPVRQNQDAA